MILQKGCKETWFICYWYYIGIMKNCLIVFFLTTANLSCIAQQTSEEFERDRWSCIEHIDSSINHYADSLNFWSKGRLPSFVFDSKFDQRFTYLNDCLRVNWVFSYRKLIFDRIVNVEVLNAITESKDSRLDEIYVLTEEQIIQRKKNEKLKKYIPNFPYATHSTRSLAQRRSKRIEFSKRMLSNND
jgi:hypothetical protein